MEAPHDSLLVAVRWRNLCHCTYVSLRWRCKYQHLHICFYSRVSGVRNSSILFGSGAITVTWVGEISNVHKCLAGCLLVVLVNRGVTEGIIVSWNICILLSQFSSEINRFGSNEEWFHFNWDLNWLYPIAREGLWSVSDHDDEIIPQLDSLLICQFEWRLVLLLVVNGFVSQFWRWR
jgi:hypothetical protein